MPLPVFYLDFREEHGRDPLPREMTVEQRRSLLECCKQNRDNAAVVAKYRLQLAEVDADPSRLHEMVAELDEPAHTYLRKLLMSDGPDAVLARAREVLAGADGDAEHWESLIRESVGLSAAPGRG